MDHSTELSELATALAEAQAKIEPARETSLNPAFRSKYADLAAVWEACRGPLTENGLSVVQGLEASEPGTLMLTTMLLHRSGQWIRSTCLFPVTKPDAHGTAAASTYARRYGLMAMVGIAPGDDDDGNTASRTASAPRQDAPAPRPEGRQQPSALSAESSGDRAATAPAGDRCPSCHAPAGKPHTKTCTAGAAPEAVAAEEGNGDMSEEVLRQRIVGCLDTLEGLKVKSDVPYDQLRAKARNAGTPLEVLERTYETLRQRVHNWRRPT